MIVDTVALRSALLGWHRAAIEIRRARLDGGPPETIARIPAERVPFSPLLAQAELSPDGRFLATPLVDGATTNRGVFGRTAGS